MFLIILITLKIDVACYMAFLSRVSECIGFRKDCKTLSSWNSFQNRDYHGIQHFLKIYFLAASTECLLRPSY